MKQKNWIDENIPFLFSETNQNSLYFLRRKTYLTHKTTNNKTSLSLSEKYHSEHK